MARNKIKIRRLEARKKRCAKYFKRKKVILKKARELAALCDVDVAVVLVSPTNKSTLFHTPRSLKDIMEKFCQILLEEREERRFYTNKTIKKLMKKAKIELLHELLHGSNEVTETQDANKVKRLEELGELIGQKRTILGDWENPERINDLERLNIMEDHLSSSLKCIREEILKAHQQNGKGYEA